MQNKYWIVDTNDLSNVKNIFIGYTISEEGELFLNNKPNILKGDGCYTYIERLSDKIVLGQDFLGMQGIYHYKNNNRNIFSNGYKTIVNYILDLKYTLTLDKNFCIQYIFSNEEPVNMNDTLLNEIKRIGKEFSVEIILDGGKVNFIEIDYEINSIKIDSKEAIDILDKWHNKWCNVYRNLVKSNSPLILDLSGGMDSRICFGIFLNSNIDKRNIIIKRNLPKQNSYAKNFDDWDISQEIVNKYKLEDRCNLKFCKSIDSKIEENSIPTFEEFDNLIYGNSKNCDYASGKFSQPIYHINGIYGDRNHLGDFHKIEYFLFEKKVKFKKDMKKEDLKILSDLMDKYSEIIFKKYKSKNRPIFFGEFSYEFINRFYGAKITTKIFHNDILICPFADSSINKIQIILEGSDKFFNFYCLIYVRYFEDLINFKFQTHAKPRIFSDEEIKFAKSQCEKYPFKKIEFDYISDLSCKDKIIFKEKYSIEKIRNILEKRLKDAEKQFVNIFGKEYFDLAMRDLKKENIKNQNYMTPIVSICSILNMLNKAGN